MITDKDRQQCFLKGITEEMLLQQKEKLKKGLSYIVLDRAARIGDGIIRLKDSELQDLVCYYEQEDDYSKIKFVPASGAASRMFKDLFAILYTPDILNQELSPDILKFFKNLNQFAFYDDFKDLLARKQFSLQQLMESKDYKSILEYLLTEKGMNYGNLPKGLIKFHKYSHESRTAFEEHLIESAKYLRSGNKLIRLHFSVLPEHKQLFMDCLLSIKGKIENRLNIHFKVEFSFQKTSTDTIAVDLDFKPFRLDDGSLLFRPGGHGALIENLNELDADIVFIKNIDNIVSERILDSTVLYKKALAGLLLKIQHKIYSCLNELEMNDVSTERLDEMVTFVKTTLNYEPLEMPDRDDQQAVKIMLLNILDRPLRVCGVVANNDEPGGGPFWTINKKGHLSLQLVELTQINQNDQKQQQIMKSATHFNPVDIVLSKRRKDGTRFDLMQYIDQESYLIIKKSQYGKDLLALELPGLWNGAMAHWLTVFVEVPIATFNPVKTIFDLIRPQHR